MFTTVIVERTFAADSRELTQMSNRRHGVTRKFSKCKNRKPKINTAGQSYAMSMDPSPVSPQMSRMDDRDLMKKIGHGSAVISNGWVSAGC